MTSKAAAVVQSVWTEGKTISDADFLTAETIILSFQCMRIPMKPAVSIAKTMEENAIHELYEQCMTSALETIRFSRTRYYK